MGKFISRVFLGFAFSFLTLNADSQLSLVATAGTTGPTGYTTLKAAFDAINAGTHNGDITITITGNTIETSSATLKESGVASTLYSSVLIKPATGSNPFINCSMPNPIIILDAAKNLTIDGSNAVGGTTKNLTISNSNTSSSANAIVFVNGASSNSIKNSVIQSSVSSLATIVLSNSTNPTGNNNNTIENNDIANSPGGYPYGGILNVGINGKPNSGNIYRNNRIFDFSNRGFADGDNSGLVGFSDNTLLSGNEFYMSGPQSTPLVAVFVRNETGITNMTISKNKIHSLSTGASEIFGILLYDAISVTVDNNMISLSNSSSELLGIAQETGAGANIKIYNNTVYISGTTSGTNSFAFFKNWFSTGDDIRNNIFVNTRVNNSGTRGQYAFVKLNTGSFTSNYNDLVSIGNANNYIGHVNAGTAIYYGTLAEWQAGTLQDANSISVTPVFVSPTDLHLNPANNCAIDNKGIPITGITSDIDGNIRSTTTPDMGADEFTALNVIPTTITAQPVSVNTCLQQTANFTVTASGAGTLSYQWKKDGSNIPGANTSTYILSNIVAGDAGNYSVVVTGGCGSISSNVITLTVSGPCTSVPQVNVEITSVILIPNPVNNTTILSIKAHKTMTIDWSIIDMSGRVMSKFNSRVVAGQNNIELELAGLGAGSYHILGYTTKGMTPVIQLIKL